MSWTYSGDPSASDRDAVRFLAQDTDKGNQLVTDEEIAYLLVSDDVLTVAVAVVDTIVGRLSLRSKAEKGIDKIAQLELYQLLAVSLRRRGISGAVAFAGGISEAQKTVQEDDSDRVEPAFARHDSGDDLDE